MKRGSLRRRLPRGRLSRNRYNSYLAPAIFGLAFLSLAIASFFLLHILPLSLGPSTIGPHSDLSQKDPDVLKVANANSDLIATVSFSQDEAMTKVQIENEGSFQFRQVKVMAGDGRVLGILSKLAPDEKKVLATKGDLGDVLITAIDPSDREVSGDVRYAKEEDLPNQSGYAKRKEPQKEPGFSGGASPSAGSSEAQLSIKTVDTEPKSDENSRINGNQNENDPIHKDTLSKFDISIITNRSSVHQDDILEYDCRAANICKETLSNIKLFCAGRTTSTTYLIPGKEISLRGTLEINDSMNINAGVQGEDADGRLWMGNATSRVWVVYPQLKLDIIAPDKVHRGQRIDLAVDVTNTGKDRLVNLSILDPFGEFGRIPILQPGESHRLTRNISLDRSLHYEAEIVGQDSSNNQVYASRKIDLNVFASGLDISADQSEIKGYSNQPVDIIWTLKNTGEECLKNVTLGCDAKRCRLKELPPGSSAKIKGVYTREETSAVNVTAEGYDPEGYKVCNMGSVLIRTIAPGITIKGVPSEIEACKGETIDFSCLIANTGDAPLADVVLRAADRVLANLDYLAPGEFRVTSFQVAAGRNATVDLVAEGKDSRGRIWSDSKSFGVVIATTGIRATASAALSGETASITCKVTNFGNVALYNALVSSETFGQLGTIDRIPPKGQRSIKVDRQIKSDVDDSISIEANTSEEQPVHTSCRLLISLPKRYPTSTNAQSTGAGRISPGLDQGFEDSSGHISATDQTKIASIKSSINSSNSNSGNDILGGLEGMICYIKRMLDHSGTDICSDYKSIGNNSNINNGNNINSDNSDPYSRNYDSSNEISSPADSRGRMNVAKDYELSIAGVRGSEHGALSILDVSASPPQPAAGQPVKISVHAKGVNSIRSGKAKWGISDAPLTKQDMMNMDRIHVMPMSLESGDGRDGYWSCTIPGRAAGTYMVLSIAFSDGTASAEDGPYMLHWSTVKSDKMPEPARAAAASSGKGMLFIESTVVNGKGEVSVKDDIEDSAVHYNERMKGNGSINLESERRVDKSWPGTNFSEKRDLVFTGGILKGQKSLESPQFDGGMGASITERFNLSHVDKSEIDMVKNANYTHNTLSFSTDQAFDGNWNIKTQYAQFYKKMKADQQYTGSFQTQKNIKFEDQG